MDVTRSVRRACPRPGTASPTAGGWGGSRRWGGGSVRRVSRPGASVRSGDFETPFPPPVHRSGGLGRGLRDRTPPRRCVTPGGGSGCVRPPQETAHRAQRNRFVPVVLCPPPPRETRSPHRPGELLTGGSGGQPGASRAPTGNAKGKYPRDSAGRGRRRWGWGGGGPCRVHTHSSITHPLHSPRTPCTHPIPAPRPPPRAHPALLSTSAALCCPYPRPSLGLLGVGVAMETIKLR